MAAIRWTSRPAVITLFGLAGIALNLWICWAVLLPGATTGRNDFKSFYAGAKLAGTPFLYDADRVEEVQLRTIGEAGDSQKFIRLPIYATIISPLARFPYPTAYLLWEILSAAAFAAGLALWPGVPATKKWLVACWSLPLFIGFFNGQDDTMVWFWIALSARLLRNHWPLAAGIALSLAASKYHFLAMIPIVVFTQKRWRFAAGIAIGGGALLALSFAVAGWDWPARYVALLNNPRLVPDMTHSPGLYGLFRQLPFAIGFQVAATILAGILVFRIAHRDPSYERPLGYALTGGILVSPHSWLADCTLLLPALLLPGKNEAPAGRVAALLLSTTVPWILLQWFPPMPTVTRMLMVWLLWAGSRAQLGSYAAHSPRPSFRENASSSPQSW